MKFIHIVFTIRFNIEPEISRGEVRDLWKTFITNQDKTLDFLQFTRHFGYSLKSAAFPNAKICPPIRGDSDCLVRSRKLNCAADMLQDNLRAKVWQQIWNSRMFIGEYCTLKPWTSCPRASVKWSFSGVLGEYQIMVDSRKCFRN